MGPRGGTLHHQHSGYKVRMWQDKNSVCEALVWCCSWIGDMNRTEEGIIRAVVGVYRDPNGHRGILKASSLWCVWTWVHWINREDTSLCLL